MQLVTYDFIMSRYPCYDPTEIGMPTDYSDTPINFITEYRSKVKRLSDINQILLRDEFLTHKEIALFAIWCARQVHHLMKDPRSIKLLDVTEAYLHGKATKEELEIAIQDAYDAVYATANATYYAAAAAYYAARDAYYAATNAAYYAARDAYYAAAAAYYAATAAAADDAAYYAAYYAAAENAQIDKLLEIFKGKENENN